jgi:hypothetical protein
MGRTPHAGEAALLKENVGNSIQYRTLRIGIQCMAAGCAAAGPCKPGEGKV